MRMPRKIYFRVFYCKKCKNLYTKAGYSRHCWGGHDFLEYTLEITNPNEDDDLNIVLLKDILKYNVG